MLGLTGHLLAVTEGKFFLDVGEGDAHLFQEDQIVIHDVAGFVEESLAVACDGFYYALAAFLAEFLGDCLRALYEEFGGIGSFRHIGVTVLDEAGKGTDEALVLRSVKAGGSSAVAGRTDRLCLYQQSVCIAVYVYILDQQIVAASFALEPELVS